MTPPPTPELEPRGDRRPGRRPTRDRFRRLIRNGPRLGACGLLLAGFSPAPILAGDASFGREIRYPTRFESTVTTTGDGRTRVVVVPQDFTTQRIGSALTTERVGVARRLAAKKPRTKRYQLTFDTGATIRVKTGDTLEFDGKRYRALGARGDAYWLMNLRSREKLRFVMKKADSGEDSPEGKQERNRNDGYPQTPSTTRSMR